jgi:hypothetical protein
MCPECVLIEASHLAFDAMLGLLLLPERLGFKSWYAMITRSRLKGSVPYVTVDLKDATARA